MAKRNSMTGSGPAPEQAAGAPRKRAPRKSALTGSPATVSDDTSAAARDIRVSDEELHRQISETAYYKAQQRGFAPGYEHQDWVEAEAEVLRRLGIARA